MKASEIITQKLKSTGGIATITLLNGDKTYISMQGRAYFVSDKLPHQEVDFSIFDIVVSYLKERPYGKADKGGCRNSKVGHDKCGKDTVMYVIATQYYGKKDGQSCFDPLFVIAAILEWAGIVRNRRGYMELMRFDLC